MSNPDLFIHKIRNNPSRPSGIAAISIFYLFGACVLFISMFTNYAGVAEQITLAHGLPLELKFIVLPAVAILAVAMSYGLYSLSRWGYYLTSIYQICFGAVSLFLSVSFGRQPFLGNLIGSSVILIYLVIKRQTFIHPEVEEQNFSDKKISSFDVILPGRERKPTMNISTQTLPGDYVQTGEVNLKKNKRLAVLLNVAAFFVFILSFIPLSIFGGVVRSGTTNISGSITVNTMLILIGLTVIVLITHELIHGFLFWVFTRSRPVFALHLLYAYAGAPNWYIPSSQYAFIALGPLVIIGVVGLLLMLVVPVGWILMIALLVALNTGGAFGDIYVFTHLLKRSKTGIVNDTGAIFTFYEHKASISQP